MSDTPEDRAARFARDGYVVCRGLAPLPTCERMLDVAQAHLAAGIEPRRVRSRRAVSGRAAVARCTRRPHRAAAPPGVCARSAFGEWATSPALAAQLEPAARPEVELSQAHHNCVMTKDPRYSSLTSWHRDIRYWSFERPELVSVWLALGRERVRKRVSARAAGQPRDGFRRRAARRRPVPAHRRWPSNARSSRRRSRSSSIRATCSFSTAAFFTPPATTRPPRPSSRSCSPTMPPTTGRSPAPARHAAGRPLYRRRNKRTAPVLT